MFVIRRRGVEWPAPDVATPPQAGMSSAARALIQSRTKAALAVKKAKGERVGADPLRDATGG